MTFGLFGTIICSTLFVLKRYTNVDIFEEETTFIPSSNAISKIISVAKAKETASKTNRGTILNLREKRNGEMINGAANANAMLMLSEVVTEATKAANTNNLQRDLHQND